MIELQALILFSTLITILTAVNLVISIRYKYPALDVQERRFGVLKKELATVQNRLNQVLDRVKEPDKKTGQIDFKSIETDIQDLPTWLLAQSRDSITKELDKRNEGNNPVKIITHTEIE